MANTKLKEAQGRASLNVVTTNPIKTTAYNDINLKEWKNYPEIKRIRFYMTFGESYIRHMRCLENVGLLSTKAINYEGKEIVPIQFLKALLPSLLSCNFFGFFLG